MRRAPLLLVPLVLLLAAAAACARDPQPLAQRLFVPVVVRSQSRPGRVPWKTTVLVRNAGSSPAFVRVFRWPPGDRSLEISELTVGAASAARIPSLVPALPAISSLTIESDRPVEVEAIVGPRGGEGPALRVPVVPLEALARPGDTLVVGTFLSDEAHRSHFAFSMPWAEHDTVPFRVAISARTPGGGRLLSRFERTIPGVPSLVEDPWSALWIPAGAPFDLSVTLLGSGRGRKPRVGLWVYGIVQERATSVSRFLPTRVARPTGSRPAPPR